MLIVLVIIVIFNFTLYSTQIYVQTLLRQPENAAKFVDEVNGGAYIYVCGTMGMGSDLHEAILNVIMEGAKLNRDDTIEFVKGLQQKGRYVQELWSDS
jgi:sulfite reductase (NADPH) flavoprotein alpha-component